MNKSKYQNRMKVFFILVSVSTIVVASYLYTVEKRKVHLNDMVAYHTKMIKSGSISSLVTLGKMYEKGEGVERNLSKAQELFKKAINFNQYIDEIYPSYSEAESANSKKESTQNEGKVAYSRSSESTNKSRQLKNIITEVKNVERNSNKSSKIKSKIAKVNPKYVPYVKKIKVRKVYKKTTKKSVRRKTASIKKTITPKINSTRIRKFIKKRKVTKTATRSKYLKKSNPVKNKYKKTIAFKKPESKIKIKKNRLEAKRSPSLYEQRTDYETELGTVDEEPNEEADEVVTTTKIDSKKDKTISKNFTSNPCSSASSRYIAKCRRANRNK